MKQTSIEWLVQETPNMHWEDAYWEDLFERAKELHKQEIIDAYIQGFYSSADGYNGEILECDLMSDEKLKLDSEQYYSETYNK